MPNSTHIFASVRCAPSHRNRNVRIIDPFDSNSLQRPARCRRTGTRFGDSLVFWRLWLCVIAVIIVLFQVCKPSQTHSFEGILIDLCIGDTDEILIEIHSPTKGEVLVEKRHQFNVKTSAKTLNGFIISFINQSTMYTSNDAQMLCKKLFTTAGIQQTIPNYLCSAYSQRCPVFIQCKLVDKKGRPLKG